jgi:hypothetical protein
MVKVNGRNAAGKLYLSADERKLVEAALIVYEAQVRDVAKREKWRPSQLAMMIAGVRPLAAKLKGKAVAP